MDIRPELLERIMTELETLRAEMEQKLARVFVTPYSCEDTREEDYQRGLAYWRSRPFIELFREYENEVRREEREQAWANADACYAPAKEPALTCEGYVPPPARHNYVEEQQAMETLVLRGGTAIPHFSTASPLNWSVHSARDHDEFEDF